MIFLILCMTGCFAQDLSQERPAGDVICKETFDYPDGELPDDWWSEGKQAVIKEGKMYVDANNGVSTVWLDRELSGNIRIGYDVHIESSTDNANNMNCFFLYSDSTGISLSNSGDLRKSGNYKLYHEYRGYIFTYVADREDPPGGRFRLRDCPGFHLLQENYTYENRARVTYRIRIEKMNNNIRIYVNDNLIIDKVDIEHNPVHEHGLFGFRTYHTELWWDNLVITRL